MTLGLIGGESGAPVLVRYCASEIVVRLRQGRCAISGEPLSGAPKTRAVGLSRRVSDALLAVCSTQLNSQVLYAKHNAAGTIAN